MNGALAYHLAASDTPHYDMKFLCEISTHTYIFISALPAIKADSRNSPLAAMNNTRLILNHANCWDAIATKFAIYKGL